jgi:hypothetical protein
MSLVAFNIRILATIGCDSTCPVALEPGWQDDTRLDGLRCEAREIFREAFPSAPWVWKDPRTSLTFSFWRTTLDVQPIVVLVTRNPFEIAGSTARMRGQERRIYTLALWERYLRQALEQIEGLPVLVTDYSEMLSRPLAWCERAHAFLTRVGVPAHKHRESDVLAFVDAGLRHAEFSRTDVLSSHDVSAAQRQLFLSLEELRGVHDEFVPPALPPETPTTEALLAERRRARQKEHDLSRLLELERSAGLWRRLRRSHYMGPARRVYAKVRRLTRGDLAPLS